jgi:ATP-dependent RNA helicase DHX29
MPSVDEPDSGDSRPPRTIKAPRPSSASRTPAQFLASPSPTPPKPTSKLDANAPTFIPSSQLSHSGASEHIVGAGKAIIKSRILSSVGRSASPSESDFDSSDPEDPNAEYVRLKMRLTDITSRRGQHETSPVIQELQARLKVVMQSYFFDERDAERQYRVERDRADAALLQARLRGSPDSSSDTLPPTPPLAQKSRSARPPKTASPLARPDIFDEDSEDSGGILAGLDEMSATEVSEQGTTISIRSMALPKHWSGRTPKKLLAETVARTDRYAVITYRIVSGSSRAKRAAVSIREKEWMMENVACVDETQAEHYAATLALHALTFPPAEHFVTGTSNLTGGQTFFRLLPAVYRDLWDELEEARKLREASVNREVWAKLRKIVEPKLETQSKVIVDWT